ncbi:MAG: HAMP domain-containing protein [Dethiobacter sp.]|jgi:signal transduction histidine kinase|nr:HAMP domain-containing protein [Dethiobacter sp.]
MFNNIRTKLTVSYLVLILAVMVLTSFFLLDNLEQYYLDYQSRAQMAAANMVAEFTAGYLRATPDVVAISNMAESFAREISSRVIITDHRQRVVGDSLRVGGLVGSVLDRPEVELALADGVGFSVQYSEQSKQHVMQVAIPVKSDGTVLGAVFISSSLSLVYRVLGDIRLFLQTATILSLFFAGLLGIVFAHRITGPIKSLTRATELMARGDLTVRVNIHSKDEMGRLGDQFNNMAGRVQAMTRQLREFVANASHELRTPLTSMNIMVKTLRDYPMDAPEREEFLKDIDNELERMTHLVENLLDLSRLDRLATEDTMQMVSVGSIVESTLEMMKKKAQQKDIDLSYSITKQTAKALIVPHQIKQVVFNLVDNALKYTQPGGSVSVTLRQGLRDLILTVADTGIGIPPQHREKVFERFYRVDKARSREQGGSGLGLAIVREIINHHGGRVWVEDSMGSQGAVFVVTLPLAGDELI